MFYIQCLIIDIDYNISQGRTQKEKTCCGGSHPQRLYVNGGEGKENRRRRWSTQAASHGAGSSFPNIKGLEGPQDFPGGPAVRTLCFQRRKAQCRHNFDPCEQNS